MPCNSTTKRLSHVLVSMLLVLVPSQNTTAGRSTHQTPVRTHPSRFACCDSILTRSDGSFMSLVIRWHQGANSTRQQASSNDALKICKALHWRSEHLRLCPQLPLVPFYTSILCTSSVCKFYLQSKKNKINKTII